MHPYLTGVPHRIGYVEQVLDYILSHDGVAFMTGEEIYNWYRGI
jgi:allantoinase